MNSAIYFDPHPLLVTFKSIIIKRSALARSYPGGVEGFISRYRLPPQVGQLSSLSCMSLYDVEDILAQLNKAGIISGQDIAVCDMHEGPLLHCNSIRFERDNTEDFLSCWFAYYDPAYEAVEASGEPCAPPEPMVAEPPPAPTVTSGKEESAPWHRVTFRTGPVHWIGEEDDVDVSIEEEEPRYKLARPAPAQGGETGPMHVVRIEYVDSMCASHGETDQAQGAHAILVDAETMERIRQGEIVSTIGQGIMLDEEGPFEDDWHFNFHAHGTVTIFLDTLNGGEVDWLEAIAVWFGDEVQPKPPGYFED